MKKMKKSLTSVCLWQIHPVGNELIADTVLPTMVQLVGVHHIGAAHQLCCPVVGDVEQTVRVHLCKGHTW